MAEAVLCYQVELLGAGVLEPYSLLLGLAKVSDLLEVLDRYDYEMADLFKEVGSHRNVWMRRLCKWSRADFNFLFGKYGDAALDAMYAGLIAICRKNSCQMWSLIAARILDPYDPGWFKGLFVEVVKLKVPPEDVCPAETWKLDLPTVLLAIAEMRGQGDLCYDLLDILYKWLSSPRKMTYEPGVEEDDLTSLIASIFGRTPEDEEAMKRARASIVMWIKEENVPWGGGWFLRGLLGCGNKKLIDAFETQSLQHFKKAIYGRFGTENVVHKLLAQAKFGSLPSQMNTLANLCVPPPDDDVEGVQLLSDLQNLSKLDINYKRKIDAWWAYAYMISGSDLGNSITRLDFQLTWVTAVQVAEKYRFRDLTRLTARLREFRTTHVSDKRLFSGDDQNLYRASVAFLTSLDSLALIRFNDADQVGKYLIELVSMHLPVEINVDTYGHPAAIWSLCAAYKVSSFHPLLLWILERDVNVLLTDKSKTSNLFREFVAGLREVQLFPDTVVVMLLFLKKCNFLVKPDKDTIDFVISNKEIQKSTQLKALLDLLKK